MNNTIRNQGSVKPARKISQPNRPVDSSHSRTVDSSHTRHNLPEVPLVLAGTTDSLPDTSGMLTSPRSTFGDLHFDVMPVNQTHLAMEPKSLLSDLLTARLTAHPEIGSQPFEIKIYFNSKSIFGGQYEIFYPDSFGKHILLTPVKECPNTGRESKEFIGLICAKHKRQVTIPTLSSGHCNTLAALDQAELLTNHCKDKLFTSVIYQTNFINKQCVEEGMDPILNQAEIENDFSGTQCLGAIVISSKLIDDRPEVFGPILHKIVTEVLESQIDLGESTPDDDTLNCCTAVQNGSNCAVS